MTDDVFFERRTRRIEEALQFHEGVADTPWERFASDPEKYASAERFLQIAVEVLSDLGAHVVARVAAGPVDCYRDVPDRLLEAGRLTETQAELWRGVIGFRDVLVHECLAVDRAIVYDVLRHGLGDLRQLHRGILSAQREA